MAKYAYIQNNFLDGEWSKLAQGKSNTEAYPRAADEIRNGIIQTSGGVTRRPGSQFIMDLHEPINRVNDEWPVLPYPGNATQSATPVATYVNVKTIPFVFSREESYEVVLIGNDLDSPTDRDVYILIYDPSTDAILFMDNINVEQGCDLSSTQYAQYGDSLILVNKDFRYFNVGRTVIGGVISFHMIQHPDLINPKTMPFTPVNAITTRHIKASATTGSVTLTSNFNYFDEKMELGILYIEDSGVKGYVSIDNVTSQTTATGTVLVTLPTAAAAGTGVDSWALNSFNNYNGWPQAVAFFQERLVLGGSWVQPDTSYFSALGNIFNFNELEVSVPSGSSPFQYTVASGEPNRICWYSPGKVLNMGTRGREYIIRSGDNSIPGITYNNISASAETSFGSLNIKPERVDNSPVFVERSGYSLREFTYNFSEDAYNSKDLLENADHLPKISIERFDMYSSAIAELAYQSYFNCLWVRDVNGSLFTITRDRQQNILAGARQYISGQWNGEACRVIAMNALPSPDGNFDDIYITVKRTIDSVERFYLERVGIEYLGNTILNDDIDQPSVSKPMYSDSCVYFNFIGPPSSLVTGLDHLEGETVSAWADGFFDGNHVVSGGEITLNEESTHVVVGLPYRTLIKPLEMEGGSRIGSSIAEKKRSNTVYIKFVRTIGAKFGITEDSLEDLEFRPRSLPMDEPVPMFTGTMEGDLRGNYESEEVPIIVQDLPMPFTVTCLVQHGVVYD